MIEGRDFAAATMIGARRRQEDEWGVYVTPEPSTGEALLLAAVADGLGGMPAGHEASRITIRAFVGSYPLITEPPAERLRLALAHANSDCWPATWLFSRATASRRCPMRRSRWFAPRLDPLAPPESPRR